MKLVFERQIWHYLFLVVLLAMLLFISKTDNFFKGEWLGISTTGWLVVSILVSIMHQFYVWFVWRTQLHLSLITRTFGEEGFRYYGIGFYLFFLTRFVSLSALAISNSWSFESNQTILNLIALIITFPFLYTMYSVRKYFGITRALGIDHFDEAYGKKPFVTEGIYKYTSNSMYTFGLLFMWIPGLLLASKASLAVALFSQLYIWVHYYTLEKPDIKRIYK
ncbi:phosphatidylethanolamine N-methyltransferase family protein [archaeon]|nr:phosphatidylethanolamine N-methyltransferase family protein [archaeon]